MKKESETSCYNYLNNCSRHLPLIFILIIICIFIFSPKVSGENTVFINEFLIDPAPQSVELYNKGVNSVDISGWYIDDNGGTTYYTIPQSNVLYPEACMVFTSDFNLNKSSSDTIRLFNSIAPPTSSSAQLIDSFSYKASSGSGVVFYRLPDGETTWATGFATLGKFNTTGQFCMISPTETPTLTVVGTTPTPAPTSYNNLFISEVMPNPQPNDHEWIELYNNNNFEVNLNNWYIDDIENAGSSPKSISLTIPAGQYGVIELSSSMFNNDTDAVRLLDFNKTVKDSFEYSLTQQGKTHGRTLFDNDEFCLQEPSKGTKNNPCINSPTSSPTHFPTTSSKLTFIPIPSVQITVVNPIRHNLLLQQVNPTIQNQGDSKSGNVLGSNTFVTNRKNHGIAYLSFTSISYSLLTIISLLVKMKKGL